MVLYYSANGLNGDARIMYRYHVCVYVCTRAHMHARVLCVHSVCMCNIRTCA